MRCSPVSSALYTTPIPPLPSFSTMRQCERVWPINSRGTPSSGEHLRSTHRVSQRKAEELTAASRTRPLLQDGDVGIGVLPEIEEILLGGTGLGVVGGERISPAELVQVKSIPSDIDEPSGRIGWYGLATPFSDKKVHQEQQENGWLGHVGKLQQQGIGR